MASYSVGAGKVGAYAKLAVASTVDTITFADNVDRVEVISDGAARLYFTTDGSTPTVAGDNCYVMPATASTRTVKATPSNGTVVKVISSGAPTYDVAKAS